MARRPARALGRQNRQRCGEGDARDVARETRTRRIDGCARVGRARRRVRAREDGETRHRSRPGVTPRTLYKTFRARSDPFDRGRPSRTTRSLSRRLPLVLRILTARAVSVVILVVVPSSSPLAIARVSVNVPEIARPRLTSAPAPTSSSPARASCARARARAENSPSRLLSPSVDVPTSPASSLSSRASSKMPLARASRATRTRKSSSSSSSQTRCARGTAAAAVMGTTHSYVSSYARAVRSSTRSPRVVIGVRAQARAVETWASATRARVDVSFGRHCEDFNHSS